MSVLSSLSASLLTVLVLTATGVAHAASTDSVADFRVGLTLMPSPKVSERLVTSSGPVTYDWERGALLARFSPRIEAGWWGTIARPTPASLGWEWTLGVNYTDHDITADSYDSGTFTANNARSGTKLNFKQFGLALGAGLATYPTLTRAGDLHWELMPVARVGTGSAETTSTGSNPVTRRGSGLWWEGGFEGAMVLHNEGWVFDLHAGFSYGKFSTGNIDLPAATPADAQTSKLTITTIAPQIGFRVGGRF